MCARAKRRYRSQRIGREGELIFERWATKNHLSANKQAEDFGIDYHCQELAPVGNGSEEVTGRSVLIQVRATSGDSRARITMSREDIETALRQETPYCLVGLHMPTEQVHFKFLDVDLAREWSGFLAGTNGSISIRIAKMDTEPAKFLEELRRLTRPTYVTRLAHTKARLAISRDLPGADFRLNAGAAGDWALVAMPLLGRAFHVRDAHEHEALTSTVFRLDRADRVYDEAVGRFALKPSIAKITDLTDGPVLLAASVEVSVTLVVRNESGEVMTKAKLRHAADERAYLLGCGLVLKVSDARRQSNGTHVHALSFELKAEGAAPLGTTADLAFLKGLVPGATLNEAGRPGIPIESFGIQRLAASVTAIEKVCGAVDVPLEDVKLADLTDQAFAVNLGFLDAMLVKDPKPIPLRPFVVGLKPCERAKDEAWEKCLYKVPFVLRFKNRSLVVWMTGEGEAYVLGDVVRGFRLGPPSIVDVERAEFEVPGDGVAAAYAVNGWAPIPIDAQGTFSGDNVEGAMPVVGEYRWPEAAAPGAPPAAE